MSKEYDNQNVSYVIHGNYHLPCITVKEQNELHIGVWANRHRQYLKLHHRILSLRCPYQLNKEQNRSYLVQG